jgi:hypothetical protein
MDNVSAGRGKRWGLPQDRKQTQAIGVFMLDCP